MKNTNDYTIGGHFLKIPITEMKFNPMLGTTNILMKYCLENEDEVIFSFSNLKFIEPAGALVFLSTMDMLAARGVDYKFESIDNIHTSAVSYGKNLGIFQQLNLCADSSHDYGGTYISPKKVAIQEIYSQFSPIETYYESFSSRIVSHAVKMLDYSVEKEVENLFIYVVRELIRNIFDHSQATHFYYASQKYPKSEFVEVAICDEGCGLRETVPFDVEERWFDQDTDENAIKKAVLPGITAESNHAYASEDYKNSGYGLALVRRIIEETGGELGIATGTKAINFTKNTEDVRNCYIKGTVVRMRLNVSRLSSINFNELLLEAESEAKRNGVLREPSRASQTLVSKELF